MKSGSNKSAKAIIAHTAKRPGQKDHLYEEHVAEVVRLAERFAGVFGAADYAKLAALTHDLGKVAPQWQAYVRNPSYGKVNHADVGATALSEISGIPPLGMIVAGHHAGLSALAEFKQILNEKYKRDPRVIETLNIAEKRNLWNPPLAGDLAVPPIFKEQYASGIEEKLTLEFFLRMLFSVLVDADFLSTEGYYTPPARRIRESPSIEDYFSLLNSHLQRLSDPTSSPVNQARYEILQICLKAAERPQGIYQLTVPTGGGKTLSSLAFALRHVGRHGLRRVIVAVPFTSIIDQTVQVYRDVFRPLGSKAVLEHHSAIPPQREDVEEEWMRLASENWDTPLIVTTTVQLFESLLSDKPSACRKLHNIAKSVIIIDEFQALPHDLWDPIITVLNELVRHYGVTVVLSTATQPPTGGFDARWKLQNVREIVPDPQRYFRRLKRVEYRIVGDGNPWDVQQLAREISSHPQVLVVMNTKRQVEELTHVLLEDPAVSDSVLTLSTRLVGKHRLQVIEEVKRRLDAGEPCRLLSTQVIEAGVDLDFPVGFRLMGPLVSIVQTAGRVNREGTSPENGVLYLVEYEDRRMPAGGGYKAAAQLTSNLIKSGAVDWHDPLFYTRYFNHLFQQISDEHSRKIQQYRTSMDYPRTAAKFRIIPDKTQPVIVRCCGSADEISQIDALIERLKYCTSREIWRRLQPYIVNLHPNEYRSHLRAGRIQELPIGQEDHSTLSIWVGAYHPLLGLTEENPEPEDYII
jgi:CRISPR-associated endonuclease/helicase Cas3